MCYRRSATRTSSPLRTQIRSASREEQQARSQDDVSSSPARARDRDAAVTCDRLPRTRGASPHHRQEAGAVQQGPGHEEADELGADESRERGPAHGAGEGRGRVRGVQGGRPGELGEEGVLVADDFRAGLLRRGDDALGRLALRPRALRDGFPSFASAVGRDDRRGNAVQQDGAGAAQGVRPDAGAALGGVHGVLRERRGLLPLLILGRARVRPHRAGRHLRAGLPPDRRGSPVRPAAAAEEDQGEQVVAAAVEEVIFSWGGSGAGLISERGEGGRWWRRWKLCGRLFHGSAVRCCLKKASSPPAAVEWAASRGCSL